MQHFARTLLSLGMALAALAVNAADSGKSPLAGIKVADNLNSELAKFQPVPMPYDGAGLSARQRQMVDKLIEACRLLDRVYFEQSDPEGFRLYQRLAADTSPQAQAVRRFIRINGDRYDLVNDQSPFVGTAPMPPGRALFPSDMTRTTFDAYVSAHPDQKQALYDPWTIVRRNGDQLQAVPYHVAFHQWLAPMAQRLREAADLSDDAAFAKYLRLRADALLTDDYYQSDLAWLDLDQPKVDLIFAPYETYLDGLLGVKTSYGAAVLIRNEDQSRQLETFQRYVADIQDALPLPAADRPSKKGLRSPMEAVDAPYRAGDLRHGYQAVADNLPNDARIHEERGTKKMFFKNYMDARVNYVILPIARRLLRSDQATQASADGYLTTTMMHEISHGLGPSFARVAGVKQDIRAAIGPTFSGLEEAKADIVGLYGLKWLVDHGDVPRQRLNGYYISEVAGILRTVRFGVAEAHGRAEMMEFNYLTGRGVIARDPGSGRYSLNLVLMPQAIADLAKELLQQEATGDRARAEAWFARYDQMPAELATALKGVADVPVDIDPVSTLPEN